MSTEENQPLYVQIRDLLNQAIRSGEIAVGTKITESSIATRFGVSRQTARFALRDLQDWKLVHSQDGKRGVWVSPHDQSTQTKKPLETGTFDLSEGYELKRAPKWERNYDQIKSELLTLACQGDFRIVASNLAESHSISRTILKDVQVRLVDDGIIRIEGRNWFLNRFDFQTISDQYSVRRILEPHALKTGFPKIDFSEAELCLERLEATARRYDDLTSAQLERLEEDLHVEILSKCGNAFLMDILRRSRLVHVFNSYYYPKFSPKTLFVREHLEVFKAILLRDVESAAAALIKHLDASEKHTHSRVKSLVVETEDLNVSYARLIT